MLRQKIILLLGFCIALGYQSAGQTQENLAEDEALENLAERNQSDITDDAREMDLTVLRQHPLNLNHAQEEDLGLLPDITPSKISAFLLYRQELGNLISLHELQAVPGWDPDYIRGILPYVYVGRDESLAGAVRDRWHGGENSLLLRTAAVVEKPAGYYNDSTGYLGSPQKLFLRYAYNFKQLLQYGFSGEKDPGEPFLRGPRRDGFDFYSFHFFLRGAGIVRALALGDFTVNFGQGLVAWQTIAFAKGGGVAAVKRQAASIRPYHSAGEYNFHRGAAVSLAKGKWSATLFISKQPLSTHPGADTLARDDIFTSFQNGGYHRTATEIANRDNNRQFSAGGNLTWHSAALEAGINSVYYHFSASLEKKPEPYNLFSLRGNQFSAHSFHYGWTFRNLHLFGEAALDGDGHPALVQGLAGSLARELDIGLLYRNINRGFESLYADAFTENSSPADEKGLYTVVDFSPGRGLRAEMYYDLFQSSWLRYRKDAPAQGREWSGSLLYQPRKSWKLHLVYRSKNNPANAVEPINAVHVIQHIATQRLRLEFSYQFSPSFSSKWRSETVWIQSDPGNLGKTGQGTLSFLEIFYHNLIMSGNCRIQKFDLPGYSYRTYIYESDMLYNFALPAYYNTGWSYYINLNRALWKKSGTKSTLRGWIRWSQAVYKDNLLSGSGLELISGRRRSRWSVQFLYNW